MKSITLGEIFTDAELDAAAKLYELTRNDPTSFNKRVVAEIVEPAMARINAKTGQENDARYWGYAIEYAIIKS